jgi:hypothetical protein
MRGFAAVFEREFYERRLLWGVALVLSLAPVVLPLVPGLLPGGASVEDLRSGLAFGLAGLLAALLALFLGTSMIASDLAERRLGFYFARPLTGWTLWAGKLTACLTLVLGAGLLVLIPAALLGIEGNPFGLQATIGGWAGLLVLWSLRLVALLLASHAASVIVRARSPWIVLDLTALLLVAGLYWGAWRRLTLVGVGAPPVYWERSSWTDPRDWMANGFFLVALLALAVAGALQVVRGRTDLRRGHRALSLSLWGILLTAALFLTGLSAWAISGGPGDLRQIWQIAAAPTGPWMALVGPSARCPGYQPSFLYNLSSGRYVRAGFGSVATGFEPQISFSADGRRAVWLAYDGYPYVSPIVLFRLDLDRPGASPVRTQISFKNAPWSFVLSPDGRRIASYQSGDGSRVTVDDIDTGRLLAVAHYESLTDRPRMAFVDPDHLRVYNLSSYEMPGKADDLQEKVPDVFELDLRSPAPKLEPVGRMTKVRGFPSLTLSPAGDRGLLREHDSLRLVDARTGEELAAVGDRRSLGSFLSDGRIVVIDRNGDGRDLRILAPDGRSELRRFHFGGVYNVVLADQPGPQLLRVVVARKGLPAAGWDLQLLDLATGGSRSLGFRKLVSAELTYSGGPESRKPSRLTLGQVGGVLWFDPTSFQPRVVLKGS